MRLQSLATEQLECIESAADALWHIAHLFRQPPDQTPTQADPMLTCQLNHMFEHIENAAILAMHICIHELEERRRRELPIDADIISPL